MMKRINAGGKEILEALFVILGFWVFFCAVTTAAIGITIKLLGI